MEQQERCQKYSHSFWTRLIRSPERRRAVTNKPGISKCNFAAFCYQLIRAGVAGPKMKKSTAVTLIISGALLTGCDQRPNSYSGGSYGTNQPITNNTYVVGRGYWHAPYHDWFPYPFNYYRPGFGYYHGGRYSDFPQISTVTESFPDNSSGYTSHGGYYGSSYHGDSSGSSFGGGSSGISRGGFGGTGHGGGE